MFYSFRLKEKYWRNLSRKETMEIHFIIDKAQTLEQNAKTPN